MYYWREVKSLRLTAKTTFHIEMLDIVTTIWFWIRWKKFTLCYDSRVQWWKLSNKSLEVRKLTKLNYFPWTCKFGDEYIIQKVQSQKYELEVNTDIELFRWNTKTYIIFWHIKFLKFRCSKSSSSFVPDKHSKVPDTCKFTPFSPPTFSSPLCYSHSTCRTLLPSSSTGGKRLDQLQTGSNYQFSYGSSLGPYVTF